MAPRNLEQSRGVGKRRAKTVRMLHFYIFQFHVLCAVQCVLAVNLFFGVWNSAKCGARKMGMVSMRFMLWKWGNLTVWARLCATFGAPCSECHIGQSRTVLEQTPATSLGAWKRSWLGMLNFSKMKCLKFWTTCPWRVTHHLLQLDAGGTIDGLQTKHWKTDVLPWPWANIPVLQTFHGNFNTPSQLCYHAPKPVAGVCSHRFRHCPMWHPEHGAPQCGAKTSWKSENASFLPYVQ